MSILKYKDKTTGEWLPISGNSSGGSSASIDVTAEVGQTIIVEEVDANGKPTKWKAMDYQPRTHYEETVVNEVEWFAEQTLMFAANAGGKNLCSTDNPIGETIVAGAKYTVVFDGEHYECVAHGTGQSIGNLSLTNASAEDTGEPFRISTISVGAKLQMFATTDGEHTISIYKVSEETVVHKVPNKFLPEGIGYTEIGEIVIAPEQTLTPDPELDAPLVSINRALVENTQYKVTWNDVPYECTSVAGETGLVILGNLSLIDPISPDTGEPFIMVYASDIGLVAMSGDLTAKVFITTEGEMVHKLDAKYSHQYILEYVLIEETVSELVARDNYGLSSSLCIPNECADALLRGVGSVRIKFIDTTSSDFFFMDVTSWRFIDSVLLICCRLEMLNKTFTFEFNNSNPYIPPTT